MKAILITKNNVDMLASRYGYDAVDVPDLLPLDYILVTDFGNDEHYDVLTKTKFSVLFEATGETLDNEFYEVRQK